MSEVVLFEAPGHVVTTQRYIWGTRVIALSDIQQATPVVENEFKVAMILSLIGLGMLLWGGVEIKLLGVLLIAGAVAHVRWSTERHLMIKVDGDYLQIKFSKTELLYQVANAINTQKQARRHAHAEALAADIASLPRA